MVSHRGFVPVSPACLPICLPICLLVCVLSVGASNVAAQEANRNANENENVVLEDYEVQPGDTCVGIAIRQLGDRNAFKAIHKYNSLGPLPHKLKVGSTLKLPRPGPTGPDANLSARRGNIAVRQPATTDWAKAILGMDLFRRWRVSSREQSTAEITFRDSSRLRMREQTIVIIYGPRASKARRASIRARLERGELRTRLAELDGKKPTLELEMPSSDAELSSGSALVSVDDAETARISNHEGSPAQVRSRQKRRRSRAVAVAPGMGSKVEKDKAPTPPKPLPPSPTWKAGADGFIGWAHRGATLRGSWEPVAVAAEYRVEISRDDKGADVVANVTVPAAVSAFEAHGFPSGDYYVSVAARDNDSFESAPSVQRKLESVAVSLVPFGARAARAPVLLGGEEGIEARTQPKTERILPGSQIAMVEGVTCALGDGEQSKTVALSQPGVSELRCAKNGQTLAPMSLEVVAVTARVEGAQSAEPALPVSLAKATPFRIAISTEVPLETSKLTVTVSDGVVIAGRRDEADAIILVLQARPETPRSGSLVISFGEGGLALATFPLAIEQRLARRPPPVVRRRRWEVGALIGGNVIDNEFALGDSSGSGGVLESGWIVGVRLGLHFSPSFAIELEGTYSEPEFSGLMDHANVLGYRAHGRLILRDGKLAPFAVAGFGGNWVNTQSAIARNDADKEIYWGLGLRYLTGPRSSVRLDVRHRLAEGRVSTFSNILEASLGISWIL